MKISVRWFCAVSLLAGALLTAMAAERKAVVTGDRVNVRGQPSLMGEVITQVHAGEQVVVLEEIPVASPRPGEPTRWMRIRLPENTPVWVFAPYIDPDEGISKVNRLNLRAGPGENFSILGRIERGTPVKEIRVERNWMEIEAPDHTHAFVAADFVRILPTTTPTTEPDLAATVPPSRDPVDDGVVPTTIAIEEDPMISAAVDAALDVEPPLVTPAVDEVMEPEEPQRRLVAREGRVIISRSIQAPTEFALESLQTRRTINFIHSEEIGLNLRLFAGRKVIVTGEELIDRRWTNTPIIEVESIRLVP